MWVNSVQRVTVKEEEIYVQETVGVLYVGMWVLCMYVLWMDSPAYIKIDWFFV